MNKIINFLYILIHGTISPFRKKSHAMLLCRRNLRKNKKALAKLDKNIFELELSVIQLDLKPELTGEEMKMLCDMQRILEYLHKVHAAHKGYIENLEFYYKISQLEAILFV